MPSHVSRDGELTHRNQARAVASAMWTMRTLGSEIAGAEMPMPLAVSMLFERSPKTPAIPAEWGTKYPFVDATSGDQIRTPFRAGVASAYLYTPLVSWDMNTLAGAVFSSFLLHDSRSLPTSDEVLEVALRHLLGDSVNEAEIIEMAKRPEGSVQELGNQR